MNLISLWRFPSQVLAGLIRGQPACVHTAWVAYNHVSLLQLLKFAVHIPPHLCLCLIFIAAWYFHNVANFLGILLFIMQCYLLKENISLASTLHVTGASPIVSSISWLACRPHGVRCQGSILCVLSKVGSGWFAKVLLSYFILSFFLLSLTSLHFSLTCLFW